jgi:16S rRNA (cytosine967-C5)-methyltransferase
LAERGRRRPGGGRPAGADGARADSSGLPRTGRDLARQVLARVERDGAFANRALAAALDRAADLSPPDRALATELVYGVLRRRARLDRALDAVADRGLSVAPEVRNVLRVGAYQLLFLDRIPSYAAVNDTVETMKRQHGARLGGLANALLRRVAERGEPPLPDPAHDALGFLVDACGFPDWLARLCLRDLGNERAVALATASGEAAPLALRANRLAGVTREALERSLAAERPGAVLTPSEVAPDALLARGLDAPGTTEAFGAGAFAIEDVGAQIVAELCGAAPGERILDACAGLGGKTAHLAALAQNDASIDALDLSAAKLRQAEEQWTRLRTRGIHGRVADLTKDFPAAAPTYQRVLLDAPCSGLGVLRRHPEVLLRRTEADLVLLAATQRRMLDVVAPLVMPGGILVYAVCTFDRAEGEDVVSAFLQSHPAFQPAPPPAAAASIPWGRLTGSGPDGHLVRLWPDRDDADAFFAARLRRQG